LQGWDPSLVVVDELHVVNEATWDAMALASGKRSSSMTLAISTPAADTECVMWKLVSYGREHPDDSLFVLVEHSAPDGCAVDDETAWKVGNPALGDFLAYQFLIDLNYSSALGFDEMEFVVAGPGARDGIRKCFGPEANGIEAEVITYMAVHQREHFDRLGLPFNGLHGRPLQLIDCQNLFCEVDKYARVAHPEVVGISGRSRIKQRFTALRDPVPAWFPPKWGLNVPA